MRLRPFAAAVGLASFSTLSLSLLLTRIYSVTMYYHFAFMVISLALLGLAVAGVAIYVGRRWFQARSTPVLAAVFMLAFALTVPIALWAAVENPISLKSWHENVDKLAKLYFAASLPFLCSGFAVSLAIAAAREHIGRIYAFDLCGAALGCVAVIPALEGLGGPGAVLAAGAVGAAAAALFALADARPRRRLAAAAAVAAAGLSFLASTESGARRFGIARNPDKFLGKREILFEKWNALSQITVAPAGADDHRWIFIDADAATRLWSGAIRQGGFEAPRRIPEVRVASLVYAIRNRGTALIIGPGGGTDVISALYHGAPRVVGVEINPIIVEDVMLGKYAEWTGHLYRDPRVRIVVDEGRSYIRRSPERFSSIQATLVDTWAAASSGAFTLSENNLYTVEAFEEFLGRLEPGGVLTVTRWYDAASPKEFLRLLALGRAALEHRGVAPVDVHRHFVIATDLQRRGTLLLSVDPFSPEDLAKLRAAADAGGIRLLFSPDGAGPGEDGFLAAFLRAPSMAAFLAHLPYDATPTTDDRPFFFYNLRRGELLSLFGRLGEIELHNLGLAILLLLLVVSTALTALFVLLPLYVFARDALTTRRTEKLRVLAYFLTLGLGYILLEIGFMQKFVLFLGHPIYALAVVLATLLLASGFGAAISGWGCARFGVHGYVRRAILALAGVMLVYAFALEPLFHALMGLPLPARIAIAAAWVLLPGLLMGALLPSGVRTADALGSEVVPWAWGLNGAASVVGSILAVTLSMNFGFTSSLLVGTAVYLAGMTVLPRVSAVG